MGGAVSFTTLQSQLGLPDYTISSSESARADAVLHEQFPQFGSEQSAVVITSPRPDAGTSTDTRWAVSKLIDELSADKTVVSTTSPYTPFTGNQVSSDGHAVLILVALDGSPQERAHAAERIQERVDFQLSGSEFDGYLTGQTPLNNALTVVEEHDQQIAELVGIPLALLVLVLTLRTFVAALVPLLSAGAGVLFSSLPLLALSEVMNLDKFALVVATVLGLGVGVDYALFVTGRFQEELGRGSPAREALLTAMRTSGRTVATAGLIVVIALGALVLIDGHVFVELAATSAVVVLASMVASLTLLPATLGILGPRVNTLRLLRPPADVTRGSLARWARLVMRRPVRFALPVLTVLLLCAAPLGGAALGLDLGFSALSSTPAGKGQEEIAQRFGPGAVSPVQTVVCSDGRWDTAALRDLGALADSTGRDPRVASTTSIISLLDGTPGGRTEAHLSALRRTPTTAPVVNALIDSGDRCAYLAIAPTDPVDSANALGLVDRLRTSPAPGGLDLVVGGMTAQYRDLASETSRKLPLVIAVVVFCSILYLVVAFRSLVLPLKAAVLNLLATAASIGLMIALFQFGWAEGLFGFQSVGTVQAFLPVAMFAILFGLSMDYEVLIVNRIREHHLLHGDLEAAVAAALQSGGRQVTAAAAIMAAVFGSLVLADVLELKQLGFGLAAAVIIDATLIRLVLVPAAMVLMRSVNWWLPRWLDAVLPRLRH